MAVFSAIFVALLFVLCFVQGNARHRQTSSFNYTEALSKSILFFEGQRSGILPINQRLKWRADSALTDGQSVNVDLVGGYYDAGDNVKFGFPMAFTITMLSWGVVEFGGKMSTELINARHAIRWGTDYLLKATAIQDKIYVQVGDAQTEHLCWMRPEDMNTSREVLVVDPSHPGSDVAAETAAALAAASLVFRNSDHSYSALLLDRAKQVFKFAEKYRGSYSDSLDGVRGFYNSYSGYKDELLWAAAWLAKATGAPSYMKFVLDNDNIVESCYHLSWDNKCVAASVLLSKAFLLDEVNSLGNYKNATESYLCALLSSQSQFTPGGLLYVQESDNLQYVTAASFLLVTYAKYLSKSKSNILCDYGSSEAAIFTPSDLRNLAKKQADYILGQNPRGISYMVGYGQHFPLHVHHRASSMPSKRVLRRSIDCNEGSQYLNTNAANLNVLVGAVVGGPDKYDNFVDNRKDYNKLEPTTYTDAPLVGVLAYLAGSSYNNN